MGVQRESKQTVNLATLSKITFLATALASPLKWYCFKSIALQKQPKANNTVGLQLSKLQLSEHFS